MDTESERMADRYDKTSPWPIVVVLGFVLSELGILFGLYPLAIGGLVMFAGSVSGIVYEAGYVVSPWRLLSGLGVALVALGLVVASIQADLTTAGTFLAPAEAGSIAYRGVAIAVSGVILTLAGIVLPHVVNQ